MPTSLLIVEDDPMISDLIISDLQELYLYGELRLLGPAENMEDAISFLKTESPEIALLDISLGSSDDRSGIRIAEYINRTNPIPIIFLSGLPQGFDQAKYTLPIGFLRKPYRKQDLADQLELVLLRKNVGSNEVRSIPEKSAIPSVLPSAVFVTTNRGELTPLILENLLFLEADGKVLKAYVETSEYPIVFTSPGLKNFFDQHLTVFGKRFFQLSRKHVINLRKVERVRDNHVILPSPNKNPSKTKEVSLAFPANSDSKKQLIEILERGNF